jgi:phage FluMu gp28-like protein
MSLPAGALGALPDLTPVEELPNVLLPYQAEGIELSHANDLFVEEKSRRTGFTYAFAADAVLTASPAKRPQNFYYISYNLDMTREFIGYSAGFTKDFNQAAAQSDEFLFDDGSEKGIKALRIDYPSGKSIVALSSRPRSLRGMQGVVLIDEAAYHDDLEAMLKAALALIMWGGRVIIISTHNGADNKFNELIEEIRAGKRKGVVHRTTLDDAIRDGLFKRICLVTGKLWSPEAEAAWVADLRATYGEAGEEELDCVPAKGSGTYMTRVAIEAVMSAELPVVRLTLPNGFELQDKDICTGFMAEWLGEHLGPLLARFDRTRRSYFGQDFARSQDLSIIAPGQETANLLLQVPFILEMRNVPFREQKQTLDYIARGLPMFAAAHMDARGNGQQLAEDMRRDWGADRIESVMAVQSTYLERMPRLKARIEDRTIIIPRNEGVLDDLKLIKLVKGVPMIVDRADDRADGSKNKRHGDAAIALMNLVAAVLGAKGPIDFHSTGSRAAPAGDFITTSHGFGTIARGDNAGGFHV